MKKMKFILPKIFGLAIITGIGAILLAAISKILIIIGIVGTVIYLVMSRFAHHKKMQQQYGIYGPQNFGQMNDAMYQNRSSFYGNDVVPVKNKQHTSGIIPIN